MATIDDSGSAFPRVETDWRGRWDGDSGGYAHVESCGGMSLRDYFAAQALTGFLSLTTGPHLSYDNAAREAYLYADAMLAARADR